jgi:MFS family permease
MTGDITTQEGVVVANKNDQARESVECEVVEPKTSNTFKESSDEPKVLTMAPDDPGNPLNFSMKRKCYQALVVILMTMSAAFSSSIFSGANAVFAEIYDLSFEVSVLSVALFTLGFTFGPPIWGPMSEVVGWNIPYWVAYGFFVACHFLVGFAPNAPAVLIGRFLEGLTGSVCLVLIAASTGDMFEPKERAFFTAGGVGMGESYCMS